MLKTHCVICLVFIHQYCSVTPTVTFYTGMASAITGSVPGDGSADFGAGCTSAGAGSLEGGSAQGSAEEVEPHRPPFDHKAYISGQNLFVSAYHGFATPGNEHVPSPIHSV